MYCILYDRSELFIICDKNFYLSRCFEVSFTFFYCVLTHLKPFKSRIKNKVLGGQAREIVNSILKFVQEEADANKPIIDLTKTLIYIRIIFSRYSTFPINLLFSEN